MEEKLLILINREWINPGLDALMAVMSSMKFWACPLLVVVVAVAFYGRFRGRAMLVVLALTVLISDSIVGNGLKHLIKRPRPNEVVAGVRIVSLNLHHAMPRIAAMITGKAPDKGKADAGWIHVAFSRPNPDEARGRSFPSDHTLNNVCAAVVLAFFYRRFGWLFAFPAALVGYSRIYNGSHWPSDVGISVIMGVGMALLLLAFYEWLWRKIGPRVMPRVYERHPNLWEPA